MGKTARLLLVVISSASPLESTDRKRHRREPLLRKTQSDRMLLREESVGRFNDSGEQFDQCVAFFFGESAVEGFVEDCDEVWREVSNGFFAGFGEGDLLCSAVVRIGLATNESFALDPINHSRHVAFAEVELSAEVDASKLVLRGELETHQQVKGGCIVRTPRYRLVCDDALEGCVGFDDRPRQSQSILEVTRIKRLRSRLSVHVWWLIPRLMILLLTTVVYTTILVVYGTIKSDRI